MTMPNFEPGSNIAIRVPVYQYNRTVMFYKEVLGLTALDIAYPDQYESIAFEFGGQNLWIDSAAGLSQSETWLEMKTDNVIQAAEYFNERRVMRRDDIEAPLKDINGFWISNPASIIHLINEQKRY